MKMYCVSKIVIVELIGILVLCFVKVRVYLEILLAFHVIFLEMMLVSVVIV